MAGFHTQVSLTGFDFQDSQFTAKLADGIVAADAARNAALTVDTSADNQFKLAGDGDPIDAMLLLVENRSIEGQLVGTVTMRFANKLPIKTGLTGNAVVARGSRLVGAGNGEVKAVDLAALVTASPTQAGIVAAIKAYAGAPIVFAVASGLASALKI